MLYQFTILLLSTCTAIVRLDRDTPGRRGKNDAVVHYVPDIEEPEQSSSAIVGSLKGSEAFHFTVSCPAINKSTCDQVKKTLKSAGEHISNALEIRKQIKVKVTFRNFCPTSKPDCAESNKLGHANAAARFPATEKNGKLFMYPQALVKQAKTDMIPQYNNFDITAEFNAQAKFYFKSQAPIAENLTDFEYVALHEITHGLGLNTGILDESDETNLELLTPAVLSTPSKKAYFAAISAYDGHIRAFDEVSKKTIQAPLKVMSDPEYIKDFAKDQDSKLVAEKTLEQVQSENLEFTTDKGVKVPLFSPTKIQQGSSISHVSANLSTSKEFLMVPSIPRGKSVDSLMKLYKMKTIYGPMTQGMLESIGYQTANNSNQLVLTISKDFGTDNFKPPVAKNRKVKANSPTKKPKKKQRKPKRTRKTRAVASPTPVPVGNKRKKCSAIAIKKRRKLGIPPPGKSTSSPTSPSITVSVTDHFIHSTSSSVATEFPNAGGETPSITTATASITATESKPSDVLERSGSESDTASTQSSVTLGESTSTATISITTSESVPTDSESGPTPANNERTLTESVSVTSIEINPTESPSVVVTELGSVSTASSTATVTDLGSNPTQSSTVSVTNFGSNPTESLTATVTELGNTPSESATVSVTSLGSNPTESSTVSVTDLGSNPTESATEAAGSSSATESGLATAEEGTATESPSSTTQPASSLGTNTSETTTSTESPTAEGTEGLPENSPIQGSQQNTDDGGAVVSGTLSIFTPDKILFAIFLLMLQFM